MPTYDYLCDNCGETFEKFQSITSKALRKCRACGKMRLKRLIGTGSGIIFKGSGFYETDYRSENYKQGQKNAKPKAKSTDKKDAKAPSGPVKQKSEKTTKSAAKKKAD